MFWRHYSHDFNVDFLTDTKSLQCLCSNGSKSSKNFIYLELLKDYYLRVLYHSGKSNFLDSVLSYFSMNSVAQDKNYNKDLLGDIHRLDWLGVQFVHYLRACYC